MYGSVLLKIEYLFSEVAFLFTFGANFVGPLFVVATQGLRLIANV